MTPACQSQRPRYARQSHPFHAEQFIDQHEYVSVGKTRRHNEHPGTFNCSSPCSRRAKGVVEDSRTKAQTDTYDLMSRLHHNSRPERLTCHNPRCRADPSTNAGDFIKGMNKPAKATKGRTTADRKKRYFKGTRLNMEAEAGRTWSMR